MRFKNPMNREALALLSKDELIDLVLSLAARLDELERRLGLNSTNSGKPPSSDGLSKPPAGKQKRRRTGSLREKSGRKPGGQKGHEGETLRQVAEPDAITDHYPETCPNCGSGLTPEMSTGHGARQVFDLPEPRPLVVMEHRAHRCRCGRCGRQTRAAFPAGVTGPVRYGARIGAMVGLPVALPALARRSSGRVDGGSVRRRPGSGDRRADGPKPRPALRRRRRGDPRLGEIGAGQAHGRDRLAGRRADPMAARRLECRADLLPGLGRARQPARWRRRHRRARPLEAVLHDARRGPCAVQRPSPSRVASPDRDREGRLGAQDAKAAPPCLPRGKPRPGAGRGAATEPRRRLPTMVGRHHGRGHPLSTRPSPRSAPHWPRARPSAVDASRAVPATTFSYVFRRARKTRYASSPTSPCPSPTIRPSRTCAWRSSSRKSPAASDPNKGRTTSRPSAASSRPPKNRAGTSFPRSWKIPKP